MPRKKGIPNNQGANSAGIKSMYIKIRVSKEQKQLLEFLVKRTLSKNLSEFLLDAAASKGMAEGLFYGEHKFDLTKLSILRNEKN